MLSISLTRENLIHESTFIKILSILQKMSKQGKNRSKKVYNLEKLLPEIVNMILLRINRTELTKLRKLSKKYRTITDTEKFKLHMRVADGNVADRFILKDGYGNRVLIGGDLEEPLSINEKTKFTINWMGYKCENQNLKHFYGRPIRFEKL